MKRKKGLDVIRQNHKVKESLISRFDEKGLTNKDVCDNAREMGYIIQQSALSRYLHNDRIVVGSLTQEQILWLCCRYCISLKLDIASEIYSPVRAKELLTKYFG